MNEIAKVSDLKGPTISGTVTVSLADLDKMRTDHAKALSAAKVLEETQHQVKVILCERKFIPSKYSYNNGYVESELVQTGIEYKNMDDFRDQIAKEEREKIRNIIEQKEIEIGNLNTKLISERELREKISVLNTAQKTEFSEKLKTTTESLSKSEKELKLANNRISVLEDEALEAKKEIELLRSGNLALQELLKSETLGSRLNKLFGL